MKEKNQKFKIYENPNRMNNPRGLYEFMDNVFNNFTRFEGIITLEKWTDSINNLFYYSHGWNESETPQFRYVPHKDAEKNILEKTLKVIHNSIEGKEEVFPRWIVFDYKNKRFYHKVRAELKKYEKRGYRIINVDNLGYYCSLDNEEKMRVDNQIFIEGKKLEEIAKNSNLEELNLEDAYTSLLEYCSLFSFNQRLKDAQGGVYSPPHEELLLEFKSE